MKRIASTQKEFHCNLNFTSHADGPGPRSIHFVCQNDFLWPLTLSFTAPTQSIHIVYTLHPFLIHLKLSCKVFPRYQVVRLDALLFALGNQKATYTSSFFCARFALHWIQILEMNCHWICTFHHWTCSLAPYIFGLVYRFGASQNIRFVYEPSVCVCARFNNNTNKLWMCKYKCTWNIRKYSFQFKTVQFFFSRMPTFALVFNTYFLFLLPLSLFAQHFQ